MATAFPEDIAGEEIEGEDLVSLDSFTAGCISAFIECSGRLNQERIACLTGCHDSLNKVMPHLEGNAKQYYSRLHRMAELILQTF
jgi:hypothetical protein